MKKIFFVLLTLVCLQAKAQYSEVDIDRFDSGWAASLSANYDVPIANLGYSFKPQTAYTFSFLEFGNHWLANFSISYEAFKPKLDTFYYQVDEANFGTISYQNYTALALYMGVAYNFRLTDQFWLFTGVNMGATYSRYAYHSQDIHFDTTIDFNEKNLYGGPKGGFTYVISNSILISLETKYNFIAPTGKASMGDRIGTLYNTWSTGASLTYKF